MTSLVDLPSVFVCKMLGYLDWQTKLVAVKAIPRWSRALRSREAWPYVRNLTLDDTPGPSWTTLLGQRYDIFDMELELEGDDRDDRLFQQVIRTYGQYFQTCKLILQFENVYMCKMDHTLLNVVINHCPALRRLVIHFPRGLGFRILQCIGDYRFMLNSIPKRCERIQHVALTILDYSPVMETAGISELFQLDDRQGLVSKLTSLDFTYGGRQYPNVPRADFLCHFTNLKTVKVADFVLSEEIIATLFENGLKDLHVIRNSLTGPYGLDVSYFTDFATDVDWKKLADLHPNTNVHYNYCCSEIHQHTFKPNPLLKSLTLDSLFNRIGPSILESVGVKYPQLRLFAQLSSEWDFHMYGARFDPDTTYSEKLLRNCTNLETLITVQTVSSADLLSVADSGHVRNIVVNEEEIYYDLDYVEDPRTYFHQRMTMMLGDGWKPIQKDEFPSYTMILLS